MKHGKFKIVCAFPLCGKTWVYRHQSELEFGRVADSDSSVFHWLHERNEDGTERITRDERFPKNYIDNALELIDDGWNLVFLSTHDAVLKELNSREIDYYIVYPCLELRPLWIKRAHMRTFNGFDPDVLFNENNFRWMIEMMERLTFDHPERRYKITSNGIYMPEILESLWKEEEKHEASRDSGPLRPLF